MRNPAILLAIVSTVLGCHAARRAEPLVSSARPVEELPPAEIKLDGAASVPLLIVNGRPVVEVFLEGKGPYKFAIETGARFVGITPRVVAALRLARVGGDDEEPLVRVREIRVGGVRFAGITAVSLRFGDKEIDGILGLNVFAELLLTVDAQSGVVRIESGQLPPVDEREVLTLKPIDALVGIDVTIAGKPFVAAVDTRGAGMLTMMPALASTDTFSGPLREAGYASGAGIPRTEKKTGRLAGDVRMGTFTVQRPIVLVHATPADFPQVPILGSQLLNEFKFTLDQKHARIRFSRSNPIVPPTPEPDQH